jgi:hypothetical protein
LQILRTNSVGPRLFLLNHIAEALVRCNRNLLRCTKYLSY